MNLFGSANFTNPIQQHVHGGAADDGVFDQDDAFAFQDFPQRRVFGGGFCFASPSAFDEGSARIAIADQAFATRDRQFVGHRIGRRFTGVRNGDNDGVWIIQWNAVVGAFGSSKFFTQSCATEVNTAFIQRAGNVGKVDPLKEAVCFAIGFSKGFDSNAVFGMHDDGMSWWQRLDLVIVKAQVQQRDAFAGGGKQGAFLDVAHRFDA